MHKVGTASIFSSTWSNKDGLSHSFAIIASVDGIDVSDTLWVSTLDEFPLVLDEDGCGGSVVGFAAMASDY